MKKQKKLKEELKMESIKVRLSKQEKDTIKYLSELNKETMSSYLLRKSMENDMDIYQMMPDKIEICNLLNEIYHRVTLSVGEQKEQEVREVFREALKKYGEGGSAE